MKDNKEEKQKTIAWIVLTHSFIAMVFGASLIAILASKGYVQLIGSLVLTIASGFALSKTMIMMFKRLE